MSLIEIGEVKRLIDNRDKIPDEFWVRTSGGQYECIWFISGQKPSVEADYSFDEERFGVTKDGKVIWGYDSGCSCPSPWSQEDYGDGSYSVKEWKEFHIGEMPELDPQWGTTASDNLHDYLKLIDAVDGNLSPSEVFKIRNQEIRRFLMKRIGIDVIKKFCGVEVLATDKFGELWEVEINGEKEKYVKVKDSSTEREYLLYVPNTIKTPHGGVAWTFGLSAEQYNPIIET